MKMNVKITAAILMMVFMCSISGMIVGASSFDCNNFSSGQGGISATNGERIIKYHTGSYMHGFAIGETIETLIGDTYSLEEDIAVYNKSKNSIVSRYTLRYGTPSLLTDGIDFDGALFFAEYTSEKMLDAMQKKLNATIENVVCLSGATSHDGIYICYLTDNGTYVLYKEYETGESLYLFTLDDFYTYAKQYHEEKLGKLYNEKGELKKGASFGFSDISGTENHLTDFEQEHLSPLAITLISAAGVVLLAAVIVTVVVIRKKKKTSVA